MTRPVPYFGTVYQIIGKDEELGNFFVFVRPESDFGTVHQISGKESTEDKSSRLHGRGFRNLGGTPPDSSRKIDRTSTRRAPPSLLPKTLGSEQEVYEHVGNCHRRVLRIPLRREGADTGNHGTSSKEHNTRFGGTFVLRRIYSNPPPSTAIRGGHGDSGTYPIHGRGVDRTDEVHPHDEGSLDGVGSGQARPRRAP